MTTPLDGIRVLDFTRVLAGPHCGRILADLGADVIKLEPPAADITRFCQPRRNSMPSYFVQQNIGKRCISVDLDTPDGVDLALQLIDQMDVVLENFRPGVMERLGLGYEVLKQRNPGIVMVSISGYGQTGPWRDRRAYAPVVHGEAGIIKSQGDHRVGHPVDDSVGQRGGQYQNDRHSHADMYTADQAAVATLAALFQRERTGEGQWVDVSMAQTMLYDNEHTHDDLWDGDVDDSWIRSFGNEHNPVVPLANGEWAIVAGHPAQNGTFEMYAKAIERLDLLTDPRFANQKARQDNIKDLHEAIRAYTATVADAEALEARFSKFSLAVGAVRSVEDIANSEWAAERGAIVEVDDRGGGRMRIPNAPWSFSAAPDVGAHGTPRYRGEDNAAVARDVLGLSADDIADLEARGVLSQHNIR